MFVIFSFLYFVLIKCDQSSTKYKKNSDLFKFNKRYFGTIININLKNIEITYVLIKARKKKLTYTNLEQII